MSLKRPVRNTISADPMDFILAAGKTPEEARRDKVLNQELPWKSSGIREDVRVGFNLRLKEEYHVKLDWLHEQSKLNEDGRVISKNGKSKSKILQDIIYTKIDKLIKDRLKEIGRDSEY